MNSRLNLQFNAAVKRRGAQITLRTITRTGTPPMPNPPVIVNATLQSNLFPGDSLISINAQSAFGVLNPGDIIVLGNQELTVQTATSSRANLAGTAGFDKVPVLPALFDQAAAGTPLTFQWAADLCTYAFISSFPLRMIDGDLIKVGDLSVVMGALDGFDPQLSWKLIAQGTERTVLSSEPTFVRNDVVSWRLQAR